MIKRLIWTIWTPMSSVLKKADKLNLSLSLSVMITRVTCNVSCLGYGSAVPFCRYLKISKPDCILWFHSDFNKYVQGSYGSGKSQGEMIFLKVREKSGNFEVGFCMNPDVTQGSFTSIYIDNIIGPGHRLAPHWWQAITWHNEFTFRKNYLLTYLVRFYDSVLFVGWHELHVCYFVLMS